MHDPKAEPALLVQPVATLPGVGAQVVEQLERLGIQTIRDLIRHYPFRYEDLRAISPISDLQAPKLSAGDGLSAELNVIGTIRQFKHVRLRGRVRAKSTAIVEDGTGEVTAVWFGRPYLGGQLRAGMRVFLRGRPERTLAGAQLSVARHRVLGADEAFRGELVPVYAQTASLPSRRIAALVRRALVAVLDDPVSIAELDPLPPAINAQRRFADARWALRAIHMPTSLEDAAEARRRLVYEEFFLLAAAAALRRAARRSDAAPDFSRVAGPAARAAFEASFEATLPFALTHAQRRVIGEIVADMASPAPMNRLLQGDVGCGKTAVAAAALALAKQAGAQAAFMAPTEILAVQQFHKLEAQLQATGARAALLIGSLRRSTRNDIVDQLARGDIDLVVGTHALLTEDVAFANLGLVVIDEQHRFGVLQRAALRAKARGHTPHTLVMTATPIPRTLAQTMYADLDVSIIDELPPGRRPVKTFVRALDAKPKIFQFAREKIAAGLQAYVVCPAIDESERAMHTAVKQAEELRAHDLKGLRVGLLHGRMSVQEKDQIMRLFADGYVQALIATTVVEVGVDIPNAAIMIVLDAERFGLSQLHQLRGRVGRGAASSFCILVASDPAAEESRRLGVLAQTNDGFVVAEKDMELRGAGELAGTRQHGGEELRLAHLIHDYPVFVEAKKDAEALVAEDPGLRRPQHARLAAFLESQARQAALRFSS